MSKQNKRKIPAAGTQTTPAVRSVPVMEKTATETSAPKWPWWLLAVATAFVLGVRLRLLHIPFERDEGAFAYIAHSMMQGKQLYSALYDSKLPGLYGMYMLFISVFDYSVEGVHLGLLLCNVAALALLFLFVRKMWDAPAAAFACVIFALMTLTRNMAGFAAHATQLLLLPLLAAFWLMADALYAQRQAWKFLVAGLLTGLAFTIKQQVFSLMPFMALFLLLHDYWEKPFRMGRFVRDAGMLALGCALPFAAILAWMYATGRQEAFWFWTYEAPVSLSKTTFSNKETSLSVTLPDVFKGQQLIWLLGGLGVVAALLSPMQREKKFFVIGMPVFTLLGIALGIAFSNHYFILMAPPLAIACALAVRYAPALFAQKAAAGEPFRFSGTRLLLLAFFTAAIAQTFISQGKYFFKDSYTAILRECYGGNPFGEAHQLGMELKKRATGSDQLLILGSEPEMLTAAGLSSPTGLLFMYDLLNDAPHNDTLQQLYKTALATKPRFLAFVNVPTSWSMAQNERNTRFFETLNRTMSDPNQYQKIGSADIFPNKSTFLWDDAARSNTQRGQYFIDVFERKQ